MLRSLPLQAGERLSSSRAAGVRDRVRLHWKLYNYTYITTLAVFGDVTLDPQVWREGRRARGYCSLYPLSLDYKRMSTNSSTFPPSDGV